MRSFRFVRLAEGRRAPGRAAFLAAFPLVAAVLMASAAAAPVAHAVPFTVDSLSLESVLRDVEATNPMLAARRAMVDAAVERRRSAGAWEAPMLEAGVVNVPTSGNLNEDDMTMKMVGVSQRIPVFGAARLRGRAAGAAAGAEASAAERAHLAVYGDVVVTYADAYYAVEGAREATRHATVLGRFVEAARARYRAGNGRLDDVLRAEADQARVRADVIRFQADADAALAQLDAMRGRSEATPSPALAKPPAFDVPLDASKWIEAAVGDHPRLHEAEAREKSYQLSAGAERRAVLPDVELRASYGQRGRDVMGMDRPDMFSASVGFALPLFSGSREGAKAREMTAMARAAAAERVDARIDLAREARALHAEASAASRMVALLADTVMMTQSKAVEASWSAYSAGISDLWRVLEANHSLYAEDLALLDARRMLARAQGKLVALTGRGDLAGIELPPVRRSAR